MHNFKITPFDLIIPHTVEFPATDYTTKRIIAQSWVRKRHPEGPVPVYPKPNADAQALIDQWVEWAERDRKRTLPEDWTVVRAKED